MLRDLKPKSLKSALLHSGLAHTFSAQFITNLLGFGSILIIALFLSPEDIGEIRVLQGYAIIALTLSTLGFNTGILKYCAETTNVNKQYSYLKQATKWVLAASIATICAFSLASLYLEDTSTTFSLYLSIILLSVPFLAIVEVLKQFLHADKKFIACANAQIMVRVLTFAFIIIGSYYWGIFGFAVSTALISAIALIRFLKEISLKRKTNTTSLPKGFLAFSLYSMLGNLLVILSNYGDVILLDSLILQKDQVGYYAIASILFSGLLIVTNSVQTVLTTDFIKNNKDKTWLEKNLSKQQLRITIVSVALSIISLPIVHYAIPFIYGGTYQNVSLYFAILCISYILISSSSLYGTLILSLGRVKFNTLIAGISLALAFIASYYFITKYGTIGIAYGKVTFGLINFILLYITAKLFIKHAQ